LASGSPCVSPPKRRQLGGSVSMKFPLLGSDVENHVEPF
jgi:hypothetical protein